VELHQALVHLKVEQEKRETLQEREGTETNGGRTQAEKMADPACSSRERIV